ncbi:hypothetical protein [Paraburkholderia sp. RL17-347-BIC-D]|uniref:hypothetical protein n=1 Tax=Paraburkholderia sp. RL17-347-BIC-D TaxID=3031632 RepID=UPI0038BCA09B
MKSRLINTVCAIGQRLPLRFSRSLPRLSQTGIALGGAVCVLTLSGCYYPYGYYPGGAYPYYATVPAAGTQQAVPVGQDDSSGAQQLQQQQQQQQAQTGQQGPPPTYAVAAPPVYVAPPYPAYYPPPVYPAYYGYPGWYGPSVSIGFGFGGYCCGHGGWGGHGHWH